MKKKSNPLENNPHFIEGQRKGEVIVKNIEFTTYKTLESALITKKTYREMLESQLGYTSANKEHAEVSGIIDTLEREIQKTQ
jgi:hypothetical protein